MATIGPEGIAAGATLREALSQMIAQGTDRVGVVDARGKTLGVVMLADLARP